MQLVGMGTDIIECARIGQMIDRHGEYFLQRVYTAREISYCQSHRGAIERFAGRWAAKEAILKALGTGWRKGISWLDLEVRNDGAGRPSVCLRGHAREQARRLRLTQMQISISHCRTYAIAFALALAEDAEQASPETSLEG